MWQKWKNTRLLLVTFKTVKSVSKIAKNDKSFWFSFFRTAFFVTTVHTTSLYKWISVDSLAVVVLRLSSVLEWNEPYQRDRRTKRRWWSDRIEIHCNSIGHDFFVRDAPTSSRRQLQYVCIYVYVYHRLWYLLWISTTLITS